MNFSGSGVGLYGGRFEYRSGGPAYEYQLRKFRWVNDVAVSGSMTWGYSRPGTVIAHLQVAGAERGTLDITWNDRQKHAQASITGRIGGRTIAATMYAP